MTFKTLIAALAIALVASPAPAKKPRHHAGNQAQAACVDRGVPIRSIPNILFGFDPEPQANGCAPPVYDGGRFVGQDPDPNVRLELRRNADNEGYHMNSK
jgi:hypothetical protein